MDSLKSIDYGGYYFFRHKAQHFDELVPVMQAGDFLGGYLALAALLVLAAVILLARGKPRSALFVLIFCTLAAAAVEAQRRFMASKRPDDARNLVSLEEMTRSFPAAGVLLLTLVCVVLLAAAWDSLDGRILRLAATVGVVLLVLWLAVSELFLGLHFVSDVVAGLAGGTALGLLCSRFFARETV
jgi:undecaprenyl-diphosphatase